MDLKHIPEPLNANERLLYANLVQQNEIIDKLTKIIELITKEQPVEAKPVVKAEAKPKTTTRRTSTRKRTTKAKEE